VEGYPPPRIQFLNNANAGSYLRLQAGIAILRLCDSARQLEPDFLNCRLWHALAKLGLDDVNWVRCKFVEEWSEMMLGRGVYGAKASSRNSKNGSKEEEGDSRTAPGLRFLALLVFCADGETGANGLLANGHAANLGSRRQAALKLSARSCVSNLRTTCAHTLAQCQAMGRAMEAKFDTMYKLFIMPEFAVPYALHLLSHRVETPTCVTAAEAALEAKTKDVEETEENALDRTLLAEQHELKYKQLKKRLKMLVEPLVSSLGDGADNISFLLRMVELIGNRYMPVTIRISDGLLGHSETPLKSGEYHDLLDITHNSALDSSVTDAGKGTSESGFHVEEEDGYNPSVRVSEYTAKRLGVVCHAAREVLLKFVKKDVNLTLHPGAIQIPSNLFVKKVPTDLSVTTSGHKAATSGHKAATSKESDPRSVLTPKNRKRTEKTNVTFSEKLRRVASEDMKLDDDDDEAIVFDGANGDDDDAEPVNGNTAAPSRRRRSVTDRKGSGDIYETPKDTSRRSKSRERKHPPQSREERDGTSTNHTTQSSNAGTSAGTSKQSSMEVEKPLSSSESGEQWDMLSPIAHSKTPRVSKQPGQPTNGKEKSSAANRKNDTRTPPPPSSILRPPKHVNVIHNNNGKDKNKKVTVAKKAKTSTKHKSPFQKARKQELFKDVESTPVLATVATPSSSAIKKSFKPILIKMGPKFSDAFAKRSVVSPAAKGKKKGQSATKATRVQSIHSPKKKAFVDDFDFHDEEEEGAESSSVKGKKTGKKGAVTASATKKSTPKKKKGSSVQPKGKKRKSVSSQDEDESDDDEPLTQAVKKIQDSAIKKLASPKKAKKAQPKAKKRKVISSDEDESDDESVKKGGSKSQRASSSAKGKKTNKKVAAAAAGSKKSTAKAKGNSQKKTKQRESISSEVDESDEESVDEPPKKSGGKTQRVSEGRKKPSTTTRTKKSPSVKTAKKTPSKRKQSPSNSRKKNESPKSRVSSSTTPSRRAQKDSEDEDELVEKSDIKRGSRKAASASTSAKPAKQKRGSTKKSDTVPKNTPSRSSSKAGARGRSPARSVSSDDEDEEENEPVEKPTAKRGTRKAASASTSAKPSKQKRGSTKKSDTKAKNTPSRNTTTRTRSPAGSVPSTPSSSVARRSSRRR